MPDHTENELDELRDLWSRHDPMPPELPDRIIAAIAADDLDFELLTLSEVSAAAVRGAPAYLLECTTDDLTLVIRVSEDSDGTRQLDGWTDGVLEVELRGVGASRTAAVSGEGRFEFVDVPAGVIRLRLRGTHKGFQTPEFEV